MRRNNGLRVDERNRRCSSVRNVPKTIDTGHFSNSISHQGRRTIALAGISSRYILFLWTTPLIHVQLIVGGDSAGGNLALALMSHILHPDSRVPELAQANQLFKGVILLSPWVTFDQSAPAFKTNAKKDVLSGAALRKWSNAFMGDATQDNYTSPLDAPPHWWTGFPANDILVLAGGDEVFVDDIQEFAQKLNVCLMRFL